jgi:hypothetical protein
MCILVKYFCMSEYISRNNFHVFCVLAKADTVFSLYSVLCTCFDSMSQRFRSQSRGEGSAVGL